MEKVKDGYKTTELGEIPEEWEVKELNDITSVITKGTTPTTYGYDFEDEGINFIKIESINDMKGTLLEETFSKISEECHKKLSRSILEEDDILFAIAGATIGKCAITTKECLPANTNQALAIIRLNKNIDSKFIFHQLRGPLIQNKIENLKTNTAQPNLNLKQISEFTILLPTLKEQQKLSLILNCVDEKIGITDNLIEKTKELKKGLMQKLLTKGIRHDRFKNTEIGRIPEEWEVKTIGEVAKFQGGYAFKSSDYVDNGIKLIKITNVQQNNLVWDDISCLPKEFIEKYPEYKLNYNDVVMAMTRPIISTGIKVCRIKYKDIPSVLNQRVGRFVVSDELDGGYLYQYALSNYFINKVNELSSTTGQPNISSKQIESILIPAPEIREQKRIALIISSVDEKIEQFEVKKEKLQKLKKGLMQKLLTGKIRVQ